VKLGFCRFM